MHAGIRTLCWGVAAALLAVAPRATAAEDKKPATASVEGKVTYQGKPLPGGTVQFHAPKGKPVVAKIDAEGSYSAPAVPVGPVKITVETTSVKPKAGGKPGNYIPIPVKYASPETSGLTLTVQEGKQRHDIELK